MPDSNRSKSDLIGLIAAALAAMALSAWLLSDTWASEAEIQRQAAEQVRQQANATTTKVEAACGDPISPGYAICAIEERESTTAAQRNEYNLEAQRTMALWTRAMGIAAIIGMTVGIIGVGLVYVTFRETRRGADHARRGADQAEKARLAYFERERGHLRIIQISGELQDGGTLMLWFSSENNGSSLLEVEALNITFGDVPVWPQTLDGLGEGLQIKLAAGEKGGVRFKTSSAVGFPCFIFGYIRYRTLSARGLKTHFSAEMTHRFDQVYGHIVESKAIPDFSLPHDT